ncbi:MAG: hypothetical protein KGQ51_00580 [Planctomycetes bacterium]|nr:hypothetical protein [Planctomycetota bacterium]
MTEDSQRYRKSYVAFVIATAVLIFVALRLPMVLFSSGQMDEQWFAVPGYTVWKEGIPRIPYCPTRKRENFFENADRCLFALPPGLHYAQAPFFGVFPAGYPTARLPSFFGGIVGLVVLGLLARRMVATDEGVDLSSGGEFIWGMALILIAMSRPMMFTSITARPDLLVSLCCWGAIACMWRWANHPDGTTSCRWELIAAGTLSGLGLLFHPFALVGCLQCGVWGVWREGGWRRRAIRGLSIAAPAAAILCLWLPLILRFPYEFQSQFTSNVLERSGPGLMQRLIWPWASIWHHARYQWEYNQAIQFIFLSLGGPIGILLMWLRKDASSMIFKYRWRTTALVLSSIYLTATIAGIHPTKGYWVYAIGWLYPVALFGWTSLWSLATSWISPSSRPWQSCIRYAWAALLILIMIPGTGMTTLIAYARDGAGKRTHASRFIHELLQEIPEDSRCIVDVHFVFDVWLSGRPTLLCQPRERFWGESYPAFDYLIIGREGEDMGAPSDYRAKLSRSVGEPSTPADCYVRIYNPE